MLPHSFLFAFWKCLESFLNYTYTDKKERNIKLTTTPYKHRPPKRPKKGHIGRTGPGASIIIGGAGCGHQFGNKQTIICCRARFRDNHHHKSCLQLWTQSLAILSLIGERLLKVFWLKVFFYICWVLKSFPILSVLGGLLDQRCFALVEAATMALFQSGREKLGGVNYSNDQ